MDDKAAGFKKAAGDFQKNALSLERTMRWRNIKLWVVFGCIAVSAIILVIVYITGFGLDDIVPRDEDDEGNSDGLSSDQTSEDTSDSLDSDGGGSDSSSSENSENQSDSSDTSDSSNSSEASGSSADEAALRLLEKGVFLKLENEWHAGA